jgi:hypothetical protein
MSVANDHGVKGAECAHMRSSLSSTNLATYGRTSLTWEGPNVVPCDPLARPIFCLEHLFARGSP